MKYVLLIHDDHANYKDEDGWNEIIRRHEAFGEAHASAIVGGEGLSGPETATTLHRKSGETLVHDGPFAEAREQLGGFYLIEVGSLDEAIAIARDIPFAADGSVEIRPCLGEE